MTRMPIDDRLDGPEHELYDETPPRSIFAATWFRALLVLVVVVVVGAISAPYIFDAMNPSAKSTLASRGVATSTLADTPAPSPAASAPPAPPPTVAPPSAMSTQAEPPDRSSVSDKQPSTDKLPADKVVSADRVASGDKPAPADKPAMAETQANKSAADKAADKNDAAKSDTAPTKRIAARSATAAAPTPSSGDWWVQVGAFRDEATANKLTARLRAQNYTVEQLRSGGAGIAKTASVDTSAPAASAAPTGAAPTGGDQYDVYVSGASTSELNTRLAAKNLAAQPSGTGSVIRPSLPLRDAVALSKDLAVDGLKVQVRRAASSGTPASPASAKRAPAASAGDTLYRVRVGAFPDRVTALTTLKELEAKGYAPFIARGAP
jgi:cell division protein FtsN